MTAANILWFSMPIQRLCDKCLQAAAEVRPVDVKILLEHFQLGSQDIKHIPTYKGLPLKFRRTTDF